jgi:hypothetical protein
MAFWTPAVAGVTPFFSFAGASIELVDVSVA